MNFVYAMPGFEASKYSKMECTCEHCKREMSRTKLYIIKNEEKEITVGSTCISDFLGHNVERMLEIVTWREQIDGFCVRDNEKTARGLGLDLFINCTLGAIFDRKGLFYSKKNMDKNDGFYTAALVEEWYECFERCCTPDTYPYQFSEIELEVYKNNILNDLSTINEKEDHSTFELNIMNCFNMKFVPFTMFSSMVGYIGAWWIKNDPFKKEDFNPKLSEYIGYLKSKVEIKIVVDKVVTSNSDYGGVIIFGHVVGTNNKFGWYTTTSNSLYNYDNDTNKVKANEGEFTIVGTVKDLKDDVNFGKTTWLTRVKVI